MKFGTIHVQFFLHMYCSEKNNGGQQRHMYTKVCDVYHHVKSRDFTTTGRILFYDNRTKIEDVLFRISSMTNSIQYTPKCLNEFYTHKNVDSNFFFGICLFCTKIQCIMLSTGDNFVFPWIGLTWHFLPLTLVFIYSDETKHKPQNKNQLKKSFQEGWQYPIIRVRKYREDIGV